MFQIITCNISRYIEGGVCVWFHFIFILNYHPKTFELYFIGIKKRANERIYFYLSDKKLTLNNKKQMFIISIKLYSILVHILPAYKTEL